MLDLSKGSAASRSLLRRSHQVPWSNRVVPHLPIDVVPYQLQRRVLRCDRTERKLVVMEVAVLHSSPNAVKHSDCSAILSAASLQVATFHGRSRVVLAIHAVTRPVFKATHETVLDGYITFTSTPQDSPTRADKSAGVDHPLTSLKDNAAAALFGHLDALHLTSAALFHPQGPGKECPVAPSNIHLLPYLQEVFPSMFARLHENSSNIFRTFLYGFFEVAEMTGDCDGNRCWHSRCLLCASYRD